MRSYQLHENFLSTLFLLFLIFVLRASLMFPAISSFSFVFFLNKLLHAPFFLNFFLKLQVLKVFGMYDNCFSITLIYFLYKWFFTIRKLLLDRVLYNSFLVLYSNNEEKIYLNVEILKYKYTFLIWNFLKIVIINYKYYQLYCFLLKIDFVGIIR